MNLLAEKQKTKIVSEFGASVDCYLKKVSNNRLILGISFGQKTDFSELTSGDKLDVKVFTPKGIVIFSTNITKFVNEKEIEISYSKDELKVEDTRQNPRYQADCPITIFRPLAGNIDGKLIDISVRGLRFYSEIPLDVNSNFEIMLYLSDTIGKIILTGRVLDKTGLPDGVHRMIIEKISYSDRQKLVDYCMSLAK